MDLKKEFKKISKNGAEYRGVPFWSWNDRMEEDESKKQIEEMKDKGFGGYFMHARTGLDIPYLGKEWMRCIKTSIEHGKKIGMESWLYDEDKYPSGFAGGLISGLGGEYNIHRLNLNEVHVDWALNEFVPETGSLKVYIGEKKNGRLEIIKEVTGQPLNLSLYRGKIIVEVFIEKVRKVHGGSNVGYVDLLNPKAVDEFINSTYEPYRKMFGHEFGKNIPGIFTDEPQYQVAPWNKNIPVHFRKRHGYVLEDHLLSLFYPIGDWKKIRRDYYLVITELFVRTFTKKLYDWCQSNNLLLTGHFQSEDTLVGQTMANGSIMAHYQWMHIPGIDHLATQITNPLLVKQVSSVAHQMGGRRVISEMFGGGGWNMSFEEQKWIAEWQFVLGVDLPCQHLVAYSLRGCRKRDHPPSLNYHQPWWPYFRTVNDRFARVLFMLTQGKHKADILVIHPIESYWSVFHPSQKENVVFRPCKETRTGEPRWLEEEFIKLSETLCSLHFDYDYGDEGMMGNRGWVKEDKIGIGSASYKVVIIPPCVTLRNSTLRLLKQFTKNGGKVIAMTPLPVRIDGKEDNKVNTLKKIAKTMKNEKDVLRNKLNRFLDPEIRIFSPEDGAETIYYQERLLDNNRKIFFLVNISNTKVYAGVKIQIRGEGRVQEWDVDTGQVSDLVCMRKDGYAEIEKDFAEGDSYMLVLDSSLSPIKVIPENLHTIETLALKDDWRLKVKDLNALTLDRCDRQIDDGKWGKNVPAIKVYEELFKNFTSCKLNLNYRFRIEGDLEKTKECYLVIETPENFQIKLNREKIKNRPSGWWIDNAFQKIDIKDKIKKGENIIELSCAYKPPIEIESCYIVGDFSVKKSGKDFNIIPGLPDKAGYENLVDKGLPFYAGSVIYSQKIKYSKKDADRIFLTFEKPDAIAVHVKVNGKDTEPMVWKPWELDISKLMKEGENLLEIKLVNSLRNLLGPHHQKEAHPIAINPASFSEELQDKYNFVPFGLTKTVKLVRKQSGKSK